MGKTEIINDIMNCGVPLTSEFKDALKYISKSSIEEIKKSMKNEEKRRDLEKLLLSLYDTEVVFKRIFGLDSDFQKTIALNIQSQEELAMIEAVILQLKGMNLLVKYFEKEKIDSYAKQYTDTIINSYTFLNEFFKTLEITSKGFHECRNMDEIMGLAHDITYLIQEHKEYNEIVSIMDFNSGLCEREHYIIENAFGMYLRTNAAIETVYLYDEELYKDLIQLVNLINCSDMLPTVKLQILRPYQDYETQHAKHLKIDKLMIDKKII